MNTAKISRLLDNLLYNGINEMERDELAEKLASMPPPLQTIVMRQISVIWPVSSALFMAFVDQTEKAYAILTREQFPPWVKAALDIYESQGLHQAQIFLGDVEGAFLHQLHTDSALTFIDIEQRLLPYINSISKYPVKLAPTTTAFTDLVTLYLPERISLNLTKRQNFLLYKLTATFLLGLDLQGTFNDARRESKHTPLGSFFASFPDNSLAIEIFYLIEATRIIAWIREHFQGLTHECQTLIAHLSSLRPTIKELSAKSAFIEKIRRQVLGFVSPKHPSNIFIRELSLLSGTTITIPTSITDSQAITTVFYDLCEKMPGPYQQGTILPFMGELQIELAFQGMNLRKQKRKEKFVKALASLLHKKNKGQTAPLTPELDIQTAPQKKAEDGTVLLLAPQNKKRMPLKQGQESQPPTFITIGSEDITLDLETAQLASEIREEMGDIPGDYISSAIGRAGGLDSQEDVAEQQGSTASGPILYDEWDFRRAGYRKNWCKLNEKTLDPVPGSFYKNTLNKYKGQIIRLRRQFEAMIVQENFIGRQREGNDIDLDAVMEAISDNTAGLSPSERLFVRLQRNERDIAALFLVDMSNSTEGWIGLAIKESLVLMCEALSILGDRYSIYGFSGMRRLRSDFYTIKTFTEPYDESIKEKISAITPMEYTRMGPAIRHAAQILGNIEAKARLLITLSDGKPEDYDDYKGAYAIEDTRHALLEAKGVGIHPFCITVDKKASDYIRHMYGAINYTLIDDVKKLPKKIPEIYRNLTT